MNHYLFDIPDSNKIHQKNCQKSYKPTTKKIINTKKEKKKKEKKKKSIFSYESL
jgi:hypothetical protein